MTSSAGRVDAHVAFSAAWSMAILSIAGLVICLMSRKQSTGRGSVHMRASWKNYRLWLRWVAVLLVPLPVAQAASAFIADVCDAESISSFNHRLRQLYGSIGLETDPFMWSWMTIYLLINGIPYAFLVLLVHVLMCRRERMHCDRDSNVVATAKWAAIACLPLPATICLYRIGIPILEPIEVAIIRDVFGYLLFRICLPLAITTVFLHMYLFRNHAS